MTVRSQLYLPDVKLLEVFDQVDGLLVKHLEAFILDLILTSDLSDDQLGVAFNLQFLPI